MAPITGVGRFALKCATLIALLGEEKVSLPGTTAYNASLSSHSFSQSAAVPPLCIVSPQTTSDVVAFVESLSSNHFSSPDSHQIVIRSSGQWFPGGSHSPDGVTLDLHGLNSIDMSTDNSIVSAGPEATWDAVYNKLEPLGLSVAGGRVAGVGVGALTLGGGISYFGPRYGWTCDTVAAYEVVLADGSVVEASEKENTDLFQGLCGGASNFGVVTRIDLKTFNQGSLWYGATYNPLSTIKDHTQIYSKIVAAENYDEKASFITGFSYSQLEGVPIITNEFVYTEPTESSPAYFEEFLSLPSVYESTSTVKPSDLADRGATFLPQNMAGYQFATLTFKPTEPMLRAAFDVWQSSLAEVKDIRGLTWSLSLEPLPPAIYQRGAASNAMGLADRNGTLVVCVLSQAWADEADAERVNAASAALVGSLRDAARSLDAYDPFVYLNYAAPWQDPIGSYGNESVGKLQELRARVDPGAVFTNLVPGGFKIPSGDVST
ncbi:putative oxidoreductase [Hypoxylon sp. FL1284]|nr:putative oxidoreductase [Hypoxylon sp. FL1284]